MRVGELFRVEFRHQEYLSIALCLACQSIAKFGGRAIQTMHRHDNTRITEQ